MPIGAPIAAMNAPRLRTVLQAGLAILKTQNPKNPATRLNIPPRLAVRREMMEKTAEKSIRTSRQIIPASPDPNPEGQQRPHVRRPSQLISNSETNRGSDYRPDRNKMSADARRTNTAESTRPGSQSARRRRRFRSGSLRSGSPPTRSRSASPPRHSPRPTKRQCRATTARHRSARALASSATAQRHRTYPPNTPAATICGRGGADRGDGVTTEASSANPPAPVRIHEEWNERSTVGNLTRDQRRPRRTTTMARIQHSVRTAGTHDTRFFKNCYLPEGSLIPARSGRHFPYGPRIGRSDQSDRPRDRPIQLGMIGDFTSQIEQAAESDSVHPSTLAG